VRADGPLDDDDTNDNFLSAHAFRSNNNVQISTVEAGDETESSIPAGSATALSHLRLVNRGDGMFEVFSSSNGMDWTSRQTVTNEALATGLLEVGVWAGCYAGGNATCVNGSARFDWAEILLGVPAGDFNEDGQIDTADYIVWRKQMGQQVTAWDGADGNGDATVDQLDYDVWRRNFGKSIPEIGSGVVSPAVPEPTSFLLALLASCCTWLMAAPARKRLA
jgi:hypothetical protein